MSVLVFVFSFLFSTISTIGADNFEEETYGVKYASNCEGGSPFSF